MTDRLPVAVWTGTFTLFGVTLHCSVLDNGQRIVAAVDVERLFAAMERGDAGPADAAEVERFARWRAGMAPQECLSAQPCGCDPGAGWVCEAHQ